MSKQQVYSAPRAPGAVPLRRGARAHRHAAGRRHAAALAASLVLLALGAGAARAQDPRLPVPPPPTAPVPPPAPPAAPPVLLNPAPAEPARVLSIADTTRSDPDSAEVARMWGLGGLRIFGSDLFARATSQFQAVTSGPVDPNYRLGPGDQIQVVLTGDVEVSQVLEVSREGTVTIPQVGQVVVQGLTLPEVEDRLYERLSRVFAGVGRGQGATTQFNASLGRLRSNQVFLAGEVRRPGAYQVSSVGTAFTALYQARGPNVNGTFRRVEVRRGGAIVQTVDVYDYLLRGDSRSDVRLEQGDIVFVPLAGRQVAITGAVRRPAIFELLGTEDLRDVLRFAGGLEATASIGRIQIDRVLPPEQRRPGVDRVLIDVDLRTLNGGGGIAVQDRDVVRVFDVATLRRNRLVVNGEVVRPGVYEWAPGLTLWGVLDRAEGLTASAYTPRAHVYRLNLEDGTRTLLTTPLLADSTGRRVGDMVLAEGDSVVIYSRAGLRNPRSVRITGFVKQPGTYTLAEGMSVRDLILAAQGLTVGADPSGVELVEHLDPSVRSDTLAVLRRLPLGGTAAGRDGRSPLESSTWIPSGRDVPLQDGDEVIVRRAPGYEPPRRVSLSGEVMVPGPYPLATRTTRLLDVLAAAGGPTGEADLAGMRIIRQGLPVGTNYQSARRHPRSAYNVVLQNGDSIDIPRRDPTVRVIGAVAFEARVLYTPGHSINDYVAQAGGYTAAADRGRVSITYPNGERATVRGRGRRQTRVTPGSVIVVPARAEQGERINWGDVVTKGISVLASVLTLLVALDRLSQ